MEFGVGVGNMEVSHSKLCPVIVVHLNQSTMRGKFCGVDVGMLVGLVSHPEKLSVIAVQLNNAR